MSTKAHKKVGSVGVISVTLLSSGHSALIILEQLRGFDPETGAQTRISFFFFCARMTPGIRLDVQALDIFILFFSRLKSPMLDVPRSSSVRLIKMLS